MNTLKLTDKEVRALYRLLNCSEDGFSKSLDSLYDKVEELDFFNKHVNGYGNPVPLVKTKVYRAVQVGMSLLDSSLVFK